MTDIVERLRDPTPRWTDIMDDAADEIERLRVERDEARAYFSRLLQIKHPTVEPLPDLLGVCTQIDNALAGLLAERDAHRDAHAAAQNVLDALYGKRERLREALKGIAKGVANGPHCHAIARAALKETGHE